MFKLLAVYLSLGLISAVILLAATSLLTHVLSPADYGIGMLFISSFELMAMLCSMGMDRVFLRYFYENDYRDRTSFLLYCCLFFIGVSVFIFSVTSFFFAHLLEKIFHLNGDLMVLLMIMGTIVYIVEIFASLMPRLHAKPSLYALGQIVQQATFLLFIVLLMLLWKKNSLIIIFAQIAALSACSAVLIYCYRNNWRPSKNLFQHLQFIEIKTLVSYGFPFAFSSSLAWIFFNIDKFLLLKWANSVELGIYTAAFLLSWPLDALRNTFILAWIPRCNQLLVEIPFKGKKVFHDTFHQFLWVFTVIASILLLSKSLLVLFLGYEFREAENIFGWLLLSVYFFGLSDIVTAGILKSKKTYWNIVISILCLLINIAACYYLIPRFGAQGAAIANAFGFGLFFLMRYIIGFYYYPFKIFRWKLFLYVLYICGSIVLANYNHFDWQLSSFLIFILISFYLEKKWLMPYFQRNPNRSPHRHNPNRSPHVRAPASE